VTGQRSATVVGGGIAGLAAAVSLLQAGWHVQVLERAAVSGEVGAGLAVTRNGMAALDALAVGEAVRAAGHRTQAAGTRDQHGRWLLRLPATTDPAALTVAWGVHRQRLHGALLAAAAGADLVTGARVTGLRPGSPEGAPALVTWTDDAGEHSAPADLVVAADGIHSVVRGLLFPEADLRYSGWTSWRAVVDDDTTPDEGFTPFWGPAAEFGVLRISDTELCWYGYVRHPERTPFPDEPAAVTAAAAGWAPAVRAVVAATDPDRLLRHDVHHLPRGLPTYVRGRTLLIGDAAHAMLPTMGQGANTSLEDGVSVGRLVGSPVSAGVPLAEALDCFDRARGPRCRQIARQSALTARFGAHVPGGLPQVLRNAALRAVPAGPAAAAGAAVLRWAPPVSAAG
jgi:2-polyprenyl-6-methoxyphenol hydroxylase-like FAD-dependent oxidoreductase